MAGLTSDTKLLLNCDGADESTDFDDQSAGNHTVTAVVTAQVDTAAFKWGTGSLLLDGDSDSLTVPDSADWDILGSSADSWTLDLWVKHDDHVGEEIYLTQTEDAGNRWRFFHSHGSGVQFVSAGPGEVNTGSGGEITNTNWHHAALCKVASEWGVYVDGTQVAHTSDSSTDTLGAILTIGENALAGSYFDGHMDEIRVQHSNIFGAAPVAGLTDTITVPTAAYTVSVGGGFLLNFV